MAGRTMVTTELPSHDKTRCLMAPSAFFSISVAFFEFWSGLFLSALILRKQ